VGRGALRPPLPQIPDFLVLSLEAALPIYRVAPDALDEEQKKLTRRGEKIVEQRFDKRLGQHVITTEQRVETR
jgi:hypothetical protein